MLCQHFLIPSLFLDTSNNCNMNVYLFFLSKGIVYEINTLHVADLVNITFLQFSLLELTWDCPVSIAQLVGQCIIICRGRSSNPRHPTYSPYKVNSSH